MNYLKMGAKDGKSIGFKADPTKTSVIMKIKREY